MILLMLACAKVPTLDPDAGDWPSVAWTPDGRVLVDGKRLLHPDTGERTGLAGAYPAFSPSGRRIGWAEGPLLHWGDTGGVSRIVETERFLDGQPRIVVAWIDEERLYVHAFDPHLVYSAQTEGGIAVSCGVWDVGGGAWDALTDCLEGDLFEIHAIDLRDGIAIVGSHGEGHPALTVVGWTPEAGARDVGFPALDLYPFGPVEATHRGDGAIDLLTPCRLEDADRPCQRDDGEDRIEEPWRHYRWTPDGLQLLRDGLPRYASVDPTGDRYAWPTEDAWCVGDPASRATTTCHPVR